LHHFGRPLPGELFGQAGSFHLPERALELLALPLSLGHNERMLHGDEFSHPAFFSQHFLSLAPRSCILLGASASYANSTHYGPLEARPC
jgi:hypothetical protein